MIDEQTSTLQDVTPIALGLEMAENSTFNNSTGPLAGRLQ
jgi:hypothetical protein